MYLVDWMAECWVVHWVERRVVGLADWKADSMAGLLAVYWVVYWVVW